MKQQICLEEIKEVRDFLLRFNHLFRVDIIKFIVDAAVEEWREQQNISKSERILK